MVAKDESLLSPKSETQGVTLEVTPVEGSRGKTERPAAGSLDSAALRSG